MAGTILGYSHFDFRRSRIRVSKDGQNWYIADKFKVVSLLQSINFQKYVYVDIVEDYKSCKEKLLEELKAINKQNMNTANWIFVATTNEEYNELFKVND